MPDIESSGAGASEAGEGGAGWDPPDAPGARATSTLVAAPAFDPVTRRYPMQADGSLASDTPVMARARHLLGIALKALPCSPTIGLDLGPAKRARKEQRLREIQDAVRRAVKVLTDAGLLEIIRVYESSPFGGTFYTEIRDLTVRNAPPETLKLPTT